MFFSVSPTVASFEGFIGIKYFLGLKIYYEYCSEILIGVTGMKQQIIFITALVFGFHKSE